MQKWEYQIVERGRGLPVGGSKFSDWNKDMIPLLAALGNEGWELVAIVGRSDHINEALAGTTTSELWVFKRQAQTGTPPPIAKC